MKWLMLCREPSLYSCKQIKRVCKQKGIELDILDPNRMLLALVDGQFQLFYQEGESYDKNRPPLKLLSKYDGVLPRFGTGSTEMGCAVLRHFEAQGTVVLNSADAFSLARNKWQSLQVLMENQLPVPHTSFAGNLVSVGEQLAQYSFPIVAKVLNGSQGNGVMLFENPANAESVLATFSQLNAPYLSQQFIAESKGHDFRAFVIGDKVVAAMQRIGAKDEFRANIHQGGTAKIAELTESEQYWVVKAAQAIGLEVAGVDFLRTQQGILILEVNASPGFKGIEQVNQVDIAEEMVSYFLTKM
ncbi:ribosomal protein S6 modification protein [Mannheimia granulomatis]|uniref:ATP-grasp domain-containing protein n=1 Tax=Mannheimia granulomatis TaxID=85402 RepID=UPI00159E94C0|nr:RimK family alpha-L-glutamate ligase [Mannheimia granulomatis]QLB14847.1 ribosomal protein S6 modification protein [Mannheimia granulomatis]